MDENNVFKNKIFEKLICYVLWGSNSGIETNFFQVVIARHLANISDIVLLFLKFWPSLAAKNFRNNSTKSMMHIDAYQQLQYLQKYLQKYLFLNIIQAS